MPDPAFDSAWIKLARARTLLDMLVQAESAYRARDPVGLETRVEDQDDGSRVYRVIATVREQPPDGWAPIIGDVAQNARSALDHAVWAVADSQARGKHTQFPIVGTVGGWDTEARRRLVGVSAQRIAIIREFQPLDADEPNTTPIAVLRDLSNRDKHQVLHAVALVSDDEVVGTDNAEITFEHLARVRPITDGEDAMRIRAVPEDPSRPMVVDPRTGFVVAIEGTYSGMLGTLDACCWFVQRIVSRLEHPDRGW